jgi:hypothetical protein
MQKYSTMFPSMNKVSLQNNLIPSRSLSTLVTASMEDDLNSTTESIKTDQYDGSMSPSIDNNVLATTEESVYTEHYDGNMSEINGMVINNLTIDDTYLVTSASDDLISYKSTETDQPSTLINDNNSDQIIQSSSSLW